VGFFLLFCFVFFVVVELEPRALHSLSQCFNYLKIALIVEFSSTFIFESLFKASLNRKQVDFHIFSCLQFSTVSQVM
jgi:hypothetical protein